MYYAELPVLHKYPDWRLELLVVRESAIDPPKLRNVLPTGGREVFAKRRS